jgi:hypothetical protein
MTKVDNKSLYYQVQRMKKRRDQVILDLKKFQMEKSLDSLSYNQEIVYLKNIILIQSVGITVFAISYITKFFGY